jgi:hypothetical protein
MTLRHLPSVCSWLAFSAVVASCGGDSSIHYTGSPDGAAAGGRDGSSASADVPAFGLPDGAAGAGMTGGTGGSAVGTGGSAGTSGPAEPAPGDYTVGTASSPAAWVGAPVTAGTVPVIVYPSSETRFPRNIYRTLFQWRGQGYGQFRLSFVGPRTKVEAFTDGKHAQCAANAAASCWEADERAWFLIASGNAGASVTVTVDGLDASTTPPTVRRSAPITIAFSRQNVEGAIFYWSTTAAGIRRAGIGDAEPEDYLTGKPRTTYTDPPDQVGCVACHVVSRDGKYLLAPVQAKTGAGLWITEVTKTAPPTPLIKNVPNTRGHGFATISPDDSRVVAAWEGKMWMLDRATGMKLGDLPLGNLQATHPDWSPDNTQLVFATGKNDAPGGASLATIPWMADKWGQPSIVVPGDRNTSNIFPMHSPDGKWIAFSRGKGGHGDQTAQLFVVGAKGGTPVELTSANRVVSNQMTDGQHENYQPTWAPPGDYHWIAFNSQREYGLVLPKGTQQIWVAAVDPAKLGAGADPSYPAFRLQFQGLEEDNHRAFWTLDVRDGPRPPSPPKPPPPDGGVCIADNMVCDPTADTCCQRTSRCDSHDDGATYKCFPPYIP